MRYIFWFWFVPMGFLWSWYFLSLNDFGLGFFSRQTHDLTFAIYGHVLGMEKDVIVRLLVKACIVDTGLIFAIYAFRKRRRLRAWWRQRHAARTGAPASETALDAQFTAPAE